MADAARILQRAVDAAGLEIGEIAYLCGVSASLVEKWLKPHERQCPSFAQLLRFPPKFHVALNKELDGRYGFGRAALLDLLGALGRVAAGIQR